jgi:predicted dehydrogenase
MLSGSPSEAAKRIGVIGSGFMARKHCEAIGVLAQKFNVEIVGLAGRNPATMSQLLEDFSIGVQTPTVQALMSQAKPTHLIVAVDEDALPLICEQLFQFEGAILFEKPFGLDRSKSESLAKSFTFFENKFVAVNRRFYPESQFVRNQIHGSNEPILGIFEDQHDLEEASRLGISREILESWEYANAIHMIDLIRFYLRGDVVGIDTSLLYENADRRFYSAVVDFDSGDKALYLSKWNIPGSWRISIGLPDEELLQAPLEKLSIRPRYQRFYNEWQPELGEPPDGKKGLYNQLCAFLGFSPNHGENLSTIHDSLKTMRLIEGIFK